jgi:hypothetical protein
MAAMVTTELKAATPPRAPHKVKATPREVTMRPVTTRPATRTSTTANSITTKDKVNTGAVDVAMIQRRTQRHSAISQ